MSDKKADKNVKSPALKRSWFQELKLEFGKIKWPNKNDVTKESVVVLVIAIILGLIIAGIDWLLTYGLSFILV